MTSTQQRAQTLFLVEQRIETVKERLRKNYERGEDLVAELQRLEREKERFLLHSERPFFLLKWGRTPLSV